MTSGGYFVQIYSEYDGWHIQVVKDSKVVVQKHWNHNEEEFGCGGEKALEDIFNLLTGNNTYLEDIY